VRVQCAYCGQRIERQPSRLRKTRLQFCGTDCKNAYHSERMEGEGNPRWLGGTTKYRGADWKEVRRRVLERDNYLCQDCGLPQEISLFRDGLALQVHHEVPYRDNPVNEMDNLVTLCVRCHMIRDAIAA